MHYLALRENQPNLQAVAPDVAWYALYTRHQHEKQVTNSLTRRGVEVFLPLYAVRSRWSDRIKTIQKPLFPCYVFVRIHSQSRRTVLETPGVHSIVGTSAGPCPIPENEIASIARALQSNLLVEPWPFLAVGDRVRIKTGPLEGIEGILVRKRNQIRLVVSVELLQRSVAVELDGCLLERVGRVVGQFGGSGSA